MLMYVTMLKKQPPLNRAFPFSNKKKLLENLTKMFSMY